MCLLDKLRPSFVGVVGDEHHSLLEPQEVIHCGHGGFGVLIGDSPDYTVAIEDVGFEVGEFLKPQVERPHDEANSKLLYMQWQLHPCSYSLNIVVSCDFPVLYHASNYHKVHLPALPGREGFSQVGKMCVSA